MKKFLLLAVLVVAMITGTHGQTDVYFNINHLMGGATFSMNTPGVNNMGNDFEFSRLEYYISEISITHDGGQATVVEDFWILVDASESTNAYLGNFDVMEVEAISFFVGVGPDFNHEDPAAYASDHPLAPQNPSMHWGWSAGYRFIALEGSGGMNLNQAVELHGLGDQNYFQNTTMLSATALSGVVYLDVDADYLKALEDISVSSGAIVHGDYGAAQDCLENMRDHVFSEAGSVVSVKEENTVSFQVFPNPSSDGGFWIQMADLNSSDVEIRIIDAIGKVVQVERGIASHSKIRVDGLQAGIYTAVLTNSTGILESIQVAVR